MRCPVCSKYTNACTCEPGEWRRVVGESFNAAARWSQRGTDTVLTDKELESIFNNPQLLEEKKYGYVVYSGRNMRTDHGVFATEAAALAWAESADRWRGQYHPYTPHLVEPIQLEPMPFPDM